MADTRRRVRMGALWMLFVLATSPAFAQYAMILDYDGADVPKVVELAPTENDGPATKCAKLAHELASLTRAIERNSASIGFQRKLIELLEQSHRMLVLEQSVNGVSAVGSGTASEEDFARIRRERDRMSVEADSLVGRISSGKEVLACLEHERDSEILRRTEIHDEIKILQCTDSDAPVERTACKRLSNEAWHVLELTKLEVAKREGASALVEATRTALAGAASLMSVLRSEQSVAGGARYDEIQVEIAGTERSKRDLELSLVGLEKDLACSEQDIKRLKDQAAAILNQMSEEKCPSPPQDASRNQ